ncbi:MAG: hypothetical protein R3C12_05295 [Planctomycetaceae bacterium]
MIRTSPGGNRIKGGSNSSMASVTESLKILHDIHLQLEGIREELVKGPRVIQARQRRIEQKEQELLGAQEQLKQARLASDRKSLDLKTLEKKLEDLKGKLNTASSNREFDIIRGQLQADEMAKSVLEDETLELFEKVDEISATFPVITREIQQAQDELKQYTTKFESQAVELRSKAAQLEHDLAAAEKTLPSEAAEKYRRLVHSRGARALALVDNSACSNCFVQLTSQQKIQIKTGTIVFCSNCGSMLYQEN